QNRIGQVQVNVLDRRASAHVGLDTGNSVHRIDVRHLQCLGAESVEIARLQLRKQCFVGSLEAAGDHSIDRGFAAEVVTSSVQDHLDARVPTVEGVGPG